MKEEEFRKNPLLKHSFEFSLMIIKYCEILDGLEKFVIAKQLLRSSTSIGANSMEAQNSESRSDFIHKLKIAAKESEETQYWLMLCDQSEGYPDTKLLQQKLTEIQKLLTTIFGASKRNRL